MKPWKVTRWDPPPNHRRFDQILWVPLTLTPIFLYLCSSNSTPTHTHTLSPHCHVHTSEFWIPATKPRQQGGNDPATTAVMMESVGGLAASLTLSNKSPNNSVNIRADPSTRSNTITHGQPPHTLSVSSHLGKKTVADQLIVCLLSASQLQFQPVDTSSGLENKTVATINATHIILILLSWIHSITMCLVDWNLWKACCSWKTNIPGLLLELCLLR